MTDRRFAVGRSTDLPTAYRPGAGNEANTQ